MKRNCSRLVFTPALAGLLIAGQLSLSLPASADQALRPSLEGVRAGLEEQLGSKAALEKSRPNVNGMTEAEIYAYLQSIPDELKELKPPQSWERLAHEIFRHRPPPGYSNPQALKAYLIMELDETAGFNDQQLAAAAGSFAYGPSQATAQPSVPAGQSRRVFLKVLREWMLVAGGLALVIGGAHVFFGERPALERVVWLPSTQGRPVALGEMLGELWRLEQEEEGRPLVYVWQSPGPDPGAVLKLLGPEERVSMQRLNELVQRYQERGERALRADVMGNKLIDALANYWATRREARDMRVRGEVDGQLELQLFIRQLNTQRIRQEVEMPPVESLLNSLRAQRSLRDAAEAQFLRRDEEASLRALVDHYRFAEIAAQQREASLAGEQVQAIAQRNPGAIAVAHRVRTAQSSLTNLLEPHRRRIMEDERFYPDLEPLRDSLRIFFLQQLISKALSERGIPREANGLAAEMLPRGREEDFRSLTEFLRSRHPRIWRWAEGTTEKWFPAIGNYAIVWLKENGRLPPDLLGRLPAFLREMTIEQLDGIYQQDARARRAQAGLEERWQGMRSRVPAVRWVVLGPSLVAQFPLLKEVKNLEGRLLIDYGESTAALLRQVRADAVAYYGRAEEAALFSQSLGGIPMDLYLPGDKEFRDRLTQIFFLLGVPERTIARELDRFAADLDALAPAA